MKPALETWYDCVKLVMKLWFKQQDYYKKNGKEAKFDEIEDFYVNIYEEEVESSNN